VIIAVSMAYEIGSSSKKTILGGSHKLFDGIFVSPVKARRMRQAALGLGSRGRSWVRIRRVHVGFEAFALVPGIWDGVKMLELWSTRMLVSDDESLITALVDNIGVVS